MGRILGNAKKRNRQEKSLALSGYLLMASTLSQGVGGGGVQNKSI